MKSSIYRNRGKILIRITACFSLCLTFIQLKAQNHFDFVYSDRGSLMSDGWSFTGKSSTGQPRNTEQVTGAVISYDQLLHPGVLRIPVDEGDLWENINSTRNTLFRDLPSDWTSIRLKIQSFNPVQNNQQATLVAYQDDDNYIQISRTFEGFNRIMFTSEAGGQAVNLNSVAESATSNLFLRLDRDILLESVTSYYSLDGSAWTEAGTVTQALSSPKLAIETGASPGGFPNADIAWAEVSTEPLPVIPDELHAEPSSLVFNCRQNIPCNDTRSLFIYSSLGKTIRWSHSSDVTWLAGDLQNGLTDGILKISVNTTGMNAGIYNGNIRLESEQSSSGPVTIPVTLIINPDVPVRIAVWKENKAGAMSVSVDDGQPSGFNELISNGFRGTYVYNGYTPPSFYSNYYNAGMEVGPHLVNHPCSSVSDDILRNQELLPGVMNLCSSLTLPAEKIISLVWPCGYTNYREQAVAAEYCLSARGYNINQLEDATPDNMMNLKSFNSHEHTPFPPADLKTLVDSAISCRKWFNLVLHNLTNDDGAITYAKGKNIWVAPIGTVVKYILQRDRFILDNFSSDNNGMSFSVSRLPVPQTASRDFEKSFENQDLTTMVVDIDDNRLVESVMADGVPCPFHTEKSEGNIVLMTDIRLQPDLKKTVSIKYREKPVIPVNLSSSTLNFYTIVNKDPANQWITVGGDATDPVMWKASVAAGGQNWRITATPGSGLLNDSMKISVICSGLPPGKYSKIITVSSADEDFYPQDIEVILNIGEGILHQNYPNPFSSETVIEYELPEDGKVTLELYNSQGQKCSTLINSFMVSGTYSQKWESGNFPSGIYFLTLRTKSYSETIKISILKL